MIGSGRTSPLDAVHRAAGAKMVPFGGWVMPLSYPSGTIEEHLACRSRVVAFDVSHLGTVEVSGPDAFDRLQGVLTNDLGKIRPGRAQYTHLLDARDASVVDDMIVCWLDADTFHVMANASNTDQVRSAVGGEDITLARAIVAVQGPRVHEVLAAVFPGLDRVGRNDVVQVARDGSTCVIAGTGYTGELGVEISVAAAGAGELWDAVMRAGAVPAGLAARDTLRLEAGLALHGHELGPGITPLQAGLGWVVSWTKGDFRGRAALDAERRTGVARTLRGIVTVGRRPAREGCGVFVGGRQVGVVTSGNFSPVLGHGIALALLDASIGASIDPAGDPHAGVANRPGPAVTIDVRGSWLDGAVVPTPFVRSTA